MSDIEGGPPPVLLPCTICSRTFRSEVLDRHVKVCEKSSQKKRRVFDSFKSRVTGTELEEFLGPAPLPTQAPKRLDKSPVKKPSQGPPKWKETHDSLIAVLRAARGAEEPPNVNKHAGSEQCPSCNRFFGPRAFDRHVEFCKEKTARIKPAASKVSEAQERLEARTKYRAPLSMKPKLTTKEKYSPMLPRKADISETSPSSSKTSVGTNSANRSLRPSPGKDNTTHFSRRSPTRISQRQRSVSPTKKSSVISSSKPAARSESHAKHPTQPTQPKIKDNLKDTDNLKPKPGTKLTAQEKIRSCNPRVLHSEDESPRDVTSKKTLRKSYGSSDDETGSIRDMKREQNSGREIKDRINRPNRLENLHNLDSKASRPIIQTDIGRRKKFDRGGESPPSRSSAITRNISSRKSQFQQKDINLPCKDENKSSRKYKKEQEPLINDLSVNDESYGIYVAACSVAPAKSPKRATTRRTPKAELKRLEVKEIIKTPRKIETRETEDPINFLNVKNSSPVKGRISRIPKLEIRAAEDVAKVDFVDDIGDFSRKDRERTATIKKKWISEMTNDELQKLPDCFELKSDLDDFLLKKETELERVESDELSRSAIWEIAGEQFLKSDGSVADISSNSMDSLCEPSQTRKNVEDDIVVLHEADPEKLSDIETEMKLSVSEPCFSPQYRENPVSVSSMRPKLDVVVFTAAPNSELQKPTARSKKSKASDVKPGPRLYIREKTFLADGQPKVKRRKLSEPKLTPRTQLKDWHIAVKTHMKRIDEVEKKICKELTELKNIDKKTKRFECFEIPNDTTPPKNKKFESFEINFKELNAHSEIGQTREENKNTNSISGSNDHSDIDKQKVSQHKNEVNQLFHGSIGTVLKRNQVPSKMYEGEKKSETHRRRHLKKVEECGEQTGIESEVYSELKAVKRGSREKEPKINMNSPQPLNKIPEIGEVDYRRDIEVEDFIISKPNAKSILSKDEKCLDELFPKPREISDLVTTSDSKTAIQQCFTLDSVYDLKLPHLGNGNIQTKMLSKRGKKEEHFPGVLPKTENKPKKENSIQSLVEIWKSKRGLADKPAEVVTANPRVRRLTPLGHQNSVEINEENYDPFKQAERQMLALLSWPSSTDLKSLPDPKSQSRFSPTRTSNLETSPNSAFTRYQNKDEQLSKELKDNVNQQKVQNATFELPQTANRKPTYSAADDWEEIFEKHFDLNRNEMTEKMTRSVKSALDGLLKSNNDSSLKNKSDISENSVLAETIYTSTPKSAKAEITPRSRSKDEKLETSYRTPNTYRKKTNRFDRITPPDDFSDSVGREEREEKSNRNSGVSLSSLSFCSQVSDTTIADDEFGRHPLEIIGTATPRSTRKKFARSQSVFDERNKMLFSKTFDCNFSSSDENDVEPAVPRLDDKQGRRSVTNNPYPKSVPSHFLRSQSVIDERCKGDGLLHSDEADQVSSPESNKNRRAKMSGDSAYSRYDLGLNRRSPRANPQPATAVQDDRLSSSGSENSLPPVNNNEHNFKPKALNFDSICSKKDQPYKMSKFCHECGSKYPVSVAKFCCECGVRRLII